MHLRTSDKTGWIDCLSLASGREVGRMDTIVNENFDLKCKPTKVNAEVNIIRARRSVLYVPGSNSKAQKKAPNLPVDGVILDLEDAVAPGAKADARQQVVATLEEGGFGSQEVAVRVNGLDTPWGCDDIVAIAQAKLDAVVFPKVESGADVIAAIKALDSAGAPIELPIWVMAETPRGILNIEEIAASHPRVKLIVLGTSDLAKELRVRHTTAREGLITSLGLCVLAARCHGLEILDGVCLDLEDSSGFLKVCQQGRDLGFDGKTLIHPKQIVPANEVFGVSSEEVAVAEEIITAWDTAQLEGQGVCVVNGQLIESLHVDEARRVLAVAETTQ